MAQLIEIVNRVRSLMAGANLVKDQVELLAAEYSLACQDVAQRLQRCQELLNKGLRGEAIHLSQEPPDLLESISVLDFAELGQWQQVTALYGLATAPALNRASAAALNEAYAHQAPLEPYLKRLRRLALERAPLSQRLEVLRYLAQLDPANLVWMESIAEIEKKRLDELAMHVQEAVKRQGLADLQALQAELKAPWIAGQPSPVLLATVDQELARIHRLQKRAELEQGTLYVKQAYASRDFEGAQRALAAWDEGASELRLNPEDPMRKATKPARDWLQREHQKLVFEQQFQNALGELQGALQQASPPLARLTHLWREARSYKLPIPGVVAGHYQEAIRRQQRTERVSRQLIIAGGVVAIGLLILAFYAYRTYRGDRQRLAESIESVSRSIQEGNLDGAQEQYNLIRQDQAWMTREPAMMNVYAQLQDGKRRDEARLAAFEKGFAELSNAPIESDPAALINLATDRARRPAELERLKNLLAAREAQRATELQKRTEEFETEVRALSATIQSLQTSSKDSEKELDDVCSRLKGLEAKATRLAPAITKQRDNLAQEVAKLTAVHAARRGEAKALELLNACFREPRELRNYQAAALEFSKAALDPRQADEFKKSAAVAAILEGPVRWGNLVAQIKADLWPLQEDKRKERQQEVGKILRLPERHPDHAVLEAYAEALAHNPVAAEVRLRKLFTNRFAFDMVLVADEASKWFLVPNKHYQEQRKLGSSSVRAIINYDYDPGEGKKTSGTKLVTVLMSTAKPAPQSELSKKALDVQANDYHKNWESKLLDRLKEVAEREDLDAILRFTWLEKLVDLAGQGSQFLEGALAKHKAHLNGSNVNLAVRWMDPNDTDARDSRKAARAAIRNLPNFAKVLETAELNRKKFEKTLEEASLVPCGFLAKDKQGTWQLIGFRPPAESAQLLILEADARDGKMLRKTPIGSFRGTLELSSVPIEARQGTLIFSRPGSAP